MCGIAEGEYGVFTDPENGEVFEGSHENGYACVGVGTTTDGTTRFVECDADGWSHGRELVCCAGGNTEYSLYEHGKYKELAILCTDEELIRLRADHGYGLIYYNGETRVEDYAPLKRPFVALKAKVLPIKARPPLVPPQPS